MTPEMLVEFNEMLCKYFQEKKIDGGIACGMITDWMLNMLVILNYSQKDFKDSLEKMKMSFIKRKKENANKPKTG